MHKYYTHNIIEYRVKPRLVKIKKTNTKLQKKQF